MAARGNAALVCFGIYSRTHVPLFLALAHTGAWLNLLNLIPVLGLDGAQATYTLSRVQRFLLLLSCLIFFGILQEGVYLFLAAGMGWRMFTHDLPEGDHGDAKTMVYYTLLLFALGVLIYLAPAPAMGR